MIEPSLLQLAVVAIPLLPLGGFAVLALFGDWIKRDSEEAGAGLMACGTVVIAFGVSVWIALHLGGLPLGSDTHPEVHLFQPKVLDWIDVDTLYVPLGFLIDPLTAVMMLVVTGVGALIHIYSLGYMAHDEDRVRYFSYLNLFTFFMLVLVMAGNLPLMFVGWEGVGLCSYLLIGFWFRKPAASAAGMKAFVVNRIGDFGLVLGMLILFHTFSTVDLVDIADFAGPRLAQEPLWTFGPVTIACLLLFLGAVGKSAQIPLHVWLPDAMEGPTPVSALIHAATMVTAGVYMVARLGPFFAKSDTALLVVATVGAATAFMAATIAMVQKDIKRVLAYSTVSQLGYMFLACGVGAFGVAIWHLFTHAFFKALLFLGAGSVIHALSGEQDMGRMGGLARRIPWTFGTMAIGTVAIAGIPPFAGFFSKDAILASALGAHRPVFFALGLLVALLTAFYMGRLLFLTFFGAFRGGAEVGHHIHESPRVMLVPLVLLAIGSAVAGLVALPDLIAPVFRLPLAREGHGLVLPIVATFVAALGLGAAYVMFVGRRGLAGWASMALRPLARCSEAKWGFDLAYDWLVLRLVAASDGLLWRIVDDRVIDGAVNRTASLVGSLAGVWRRSQTGLVRTYILATLGGAVLVIGWLTWP